MIQRDRGVGVCTLILVPIHLSTFSQIYWWQIGRSSISIRFSTPISCVKLDFEDKLFWAAFGKQSRMDIRCFHGKNLWAFLLGHMHKKEARQVAGKTCRIFEAIPLLSRFKALVLTTRTIVLPNTEASYKCLMTVWPGSHSLGRLRSKATCIKKRSIQARSRCW